jgi:hypothetical protein
MMAVTEIQVQSIHLALGRTVLEAAFTELRLTLGILILIAAVVFQNKKNVHARTKASFKRLRPDEFEVIRGSVVLRKLAMGRAGKPSDGEIESGRAELPFIIAVGREIDNSRRWIRMA